MSFNKKTIKDLNLNGQSVLLSVDYNVPGDDSGRVVNDARIQASLPTIKYLLEKDCAICIISHRGRPGGKIVPKFSLEPVAPILSQLINRKVSFVNDCIGDTAQQAKQAIKPKQILLLENTRFHPEEQTDDDKFAAQLAEYMDVFVQDAFGNAHRKHASMDAVTRHLPSVAGLLLVKEVDTITEVMEKPNRPLAAIIGGAKIADKIEVLNKFIEIADFVAIGGGMANTFLRAEGIPTAKSLVEAEDLPVAKDVLARAKAKAAKQQFIFYIPQDGVVATSLDRTAKTRIVDWSAHVIADVENYPKRPAEATRHIKSDEMILDIGPFSGAFIAGSLQLAGTVVWNGTLGVTETAGLQGPIGPFAHGTELIIEAMLGQFGHRPYSLVGGGDTESYLDQRHLTDSFDHVSTGGGAALELMAGHKLPGVEALENK